MSWAHPGCHTSAGESGAGFGRLGQAVSGKCEGWSRGAGLRTVIESLYGVAMRRRLKTIEAGVAGAISGGAVWMLRPT